MDFKFKKVDDGDVKLVTEATETQETDLNEQSIKDEINGCRSRIKYLKGLLKAKKAFDEKESDEGVETVDLEKETMDAVE